MLRLGVHDAVLTVEDHLSEERAYTLHYKALRYGLTESVTQILRQEQSNSAQEAQLEICESSFRSRCKRVILWEVAPDSSYFVLGDPIHSRFYVYAKTPRLPQDELHCLLGRLVDKHCYMHEIFDASVVMKHSRPE